MDQDLLDEIYKVEEDSREELNENCDNPFDMAQF